MFVKRLRFLLCVTLMLSLMTVLSIHAQEDEGGSGQGSGLIIETNIRSVDGTRLNPLWCNDDDCERLNALMFPSLYGVDSLRKVPVLAAPDNIALVTEVEDMGDNMQRLTLRDDLTWNDGKPVTAYDVFYTYVAINLLRFGTGAYAEIPSYVTEARPTGEYEIEFAYPQVDCTLPFTTNFQVIPAHLFDPDFAESVTSYESNDETIAQWLDGWWQTYPLRTINNVANGSEDFALPISSGLFNVAEVLPQEEVRLLTDDGQLGYVLADNNSPVDRIELLLNGETNLLFNPPLEDRDELRARSDLQVSQYPGLTGLYIALNLADPREQLPAYDLEGEALDQGHHPVFGDVRVRRALQMGINVQELIDVAYLGDGTPLASYQLPASWAFDETLQPVAYDPARARILLNQAGWVSDDGGLRRCVDCLYGFDNQGLGFELYYAPEYELVAQFIANQLLQIGVSVALNRSSPRDFEIAASRQEIDAYLLSHTEAFPVNPDQTLLFTDAGDIYPEAINTGSYHNPRVAELFEEARTLPGCDIDARAEIYHEIQTILQEDQPYLWLFAPDEMVVASGGVQGFDPLPNAPFWNIQSWRVVR